MSIHCYASYEYAYSAVSVTPTEINGENYEHEQPPLHPFSPCMWEPRSGTQIIYIIPCGYAIRVWNTHGSFYCFQLLNCRLGLVFQIIVMLKSSIVPQAQLPGP